jgi:hypothetical protein
MQNNSIVKVVLIFLLTCTFQFLATGTVFSEEQIDYNSLVGEWVRPDGGYIIRIQGIKPDGSIDVGYFNPKEINIAEANVSRWKGLNKLFIKLQDEGYPGSTYTLYYYADKDALAGFYYQAALKETYEVVFLRKE